MNDALTCTQKIILAASKLPESFHESDVTEAVWESDRPTFGMRTKEDLYPCSNKVRGYIIGARGLIARGYFIKVKPLVYSLTAAARAEAERLSNGHASRRPLHLNVIPRDLEDRLAAMLNSASFGRWRTGLSEAIGLPNARAFFGLAREVAAPPGGLDELIDATAGVIEQAERYLVGDSLTLRSGRVVSATELCRLRIFHAWLTNRFQIALEREREKAATPR